MGTNPASPHEKLSAALDNYFELSEILRADMHELLDVEQRESRRLAALFAPENRIQHWRRNVIRANSVLVEGYINSLLDICQVGLEYENTPLTKSDRAFLQNPTSADNMCERVKLTLRAAYKLFDVAPMPDFSSEDWRNAQKFLSKRHVLMHPKSPNDLSVPNALWAEISSGSEWLIS